MTRGVMYDRSRSKPASRKRRLLLETRWRSEREEGMGILAGDESESGLAVFGMGERSGEGSGSGERTGAVTSRCAATKKSAGKRLCLRSEAAPSSSALLRRTTARLDPCSGTRHAGCIQKDSILRFAFGSPSNSVTLKSDSR